MTRRRKFADRALQQTYDTLRANPPSPTAQSLAAYRMRGSASAAYVRGWERPDEPDKLSVRGSIAYAAWAAGVDNSREAERLDSKG